MNIYLECIPCVVRQAVEAARMSTKDERLREKVVRAALEHISSLSFDTTPPHLGMEVHRIVKRLAGNGDPYRDLKVASNRKALDIYPSLKERVRESEDPLRTAALLAIAGNLIDFGLPSSGDLSMRDIVEQALTSPVAIYMPSGRLRTRRGTSSMPRTTRGRLSSTESSSKRSRTSGTRSPSR